MKKEYRVVKELSAESGFGWDSDRKMVTAPDSVWESLETRRNKDALRWRDKSFPYYDDLFALYDGEYHSWTLLLSLAFAHINPVIALIYNFFNSIYAWRYASGKNCHGMDHYANKGKEPTGASFSVILDVSDSQLESPEPTLPAPGASSLNFQVGEGGCRDYTNWLGTAAFNPVSNLGDVSAFLDSSEGAHALHSSDQVMLQSPHFSSQPCGSTSQAAGAKRLKRQKISTTTSTEDFHERYLKLKKEEIDRFVAIEERKMEDPYSIQKCVRTIEGMADLLHVEDMIKAADIFKENPANREVFLSFSTNELRLGWLRNQI